MIASHLILVEKVMIVKEKRFQAIVSVLLFLCINIATKADDNPFAGLEKPKISSFSHSNSESSHSQSLSNSIRYLKKEIISVYSRKLEDSGGHNIKQVLGLEYLHKFSDQLASRSSFNIQLQFVFRDSQNWMQINHGTPSRWEMETHNFYLDVYQALDSFMTKTERARNIGRFNLRIGRFYLPLGLNLQTDTHATLLHLSNEQHLGYDRDWLIGFYGAFNENLKYDLYFMLGSGHDAVLKEQKGLIGGRISLAGKFLYEQGYEAGVSFITGERLSHSHPKNKHIQTSRAAFDVRYTKPLTNGTLKSLAEIYHGKDNFQTVSSFLGQVELLTSDRKHGYALQFRHFDRHGQKPDAGGMIHATAKDGIDSWSGLEYTRYLHNDLMGNQLEWIKFLIEKPLKSRTGFEDLQVTVQYYSYW